MPWPRHYTSIKPPFPRWSGARTCTSARCAITSVPWVVNWRSSQPFPRGRSRSITSPVESGGSAAQAGNLIAGTASASGKAIEAAFLQKIRQMTGCRRLTDFGDCLVLRSIDATLEPSLTAIEQPVDNFELFRRELKMAMLLPIPCLDQYPVDVGLGLLQAAQQSFQEPLQPRGDIQRVLLAGLEYFVIALPVFENARGHRIEPNRLLFALRQCQIGEGAGQATIAIIEWMQGHEPEMRNAGTQQWVECRICLTGVEPVDKRHQLFVEPGPRWCLEMHDRSIQTSGDHLHRLVTAQHADTDFRCQRAFVGLEKQCVPIQQALKAQRRLVVLRCVQQQFRQALATWAGGLVGAQPQASCQ